MRRKAFIYHLSIIVSEYVVLSQLFGKIHNKFIILIPNPPGEIELSAVFWVDSDCYDKKLAVCRLKKTVPVSPKQFKAIPPGSDGTNAQSYFSPNDTN